MGVGQVSVAAATAVVGYDLLQGSWFQNVATNRALTGFGLRGSAAAIDTAVDLFVDTKKIGTFYNTNTGMVNNDDLVPLDGNFVPAGAQIHAYVTDAPATNPINLELVWKEL